jgi:hypothetical protein
VSHAAPYNHFADKSELLAEEGVLGFEALRREMEKGADPQHHSRGEALTGVGTAYIRFGGENPGHAGQRPATVNETSPENHETVMPPSIS